MIVPRTRLLVVFALTVVPAAALAAMPGAEAPAFLFMAVFTVVVLLDAAIGVRRAREVELRMPAVVRFVRRRKGVLPVAIRGGSGTVRIGLTLAAELECARNDFEVALPAGEAEWATVSLDCEPRKRGIFAIRAGAVESGSPLGLWGARNRIALNCEVRVYPDLRTDTQVLAPLLTRRSSGLHLQRQTGRGREFENLREYIPGDAINEIHWKATARRSRLVTRTFRVERTQEIYAIVDASRLTGRETGDGESVLERFVTAALILALASRQQGDRFGLITFSDTLHSFVAAGSTHAHFGACRDALLRLEPRMVTPDYAELAATIDARLRRRAMLLFMTELDDPVLSEDFLRALAPLARRHFIAVASVREAGSKPMFELPAGSVGEVYQRLAGHLAWRRLQELNRRLAARGVHMIDADASRLALELTRYYRNAKLRQAI